MKPWFHGGNFKRRDVIPKKVAGSFLGGGNSNTSLFSFLFGEDGAQFDEHIFEMGGEQPTTSFFYLFFLNIVVVYVQVCFLHVFF